MDQKKIGEFICKLRKDKKLTQANLAEMLNISNRTVSKWENGDGLPDITILPKLSEILGVTVDELLNAEKKEIAQLKVTEIESRDNVNNVFQITYTIALFLGIFGAVLGFVTLAYNIWAFNILFYNHWEIMFVAISLFSCLASALAYTVGITKLRLRYSSKEIVSIAGKQGWYLVMILSVLPIMFALRVIDVTRLSYLKWLFAIVFAVIWLIFVILARRKINEKSN